MKSFLTLSLYSVPISFFQRSSRNCITLWLITFLVVISMSITMCSTEPSPEKTSKDYVVPRRHVRLVIRNPSSVTRRNSNTLLTRYVRERDRTLVRVIRTKRRKRNKDVLHIAPTHMRTVRLKSKTGFFLEIQPSGRVTGHVNKTKYSKFLKIYIFIDIL